MRLLCVSDQIDPLIYSEAIKERYSDVDAIFCAGDLSLDYVDYIVTNLNKPAFFIFGNHNLKEFRYYEKTGAYGDDPSTLNKADLSHHHGGDYISKKVVINRYLNFCDGNKKTPLLIAGISGSLRYNNGQNQFSEFKMKLRLLSMVPSLIKNKLRYGRYCDVFLAHASPRHIHDKEDPCHKGFECFNWFIKKFKPRLFLHGHIHLYDLQAKRVTETEETTVVNVFSHVVIDINMNASKGDKLGFDVSVFTDK